MTIVEPETRCAHLDCVRQNSLPPTGLLAYQDGPVVGMTALTKEALDRFFLIGTERSRTDCQDGTQPGSYAPPSDLH